MTAGKLSGDNGMNKLFIATVILLSVMPALADPMTEAEHCKQIAETKFSEKAMHSYHYNRSDKTCYVKTVHEYKSGLITTELWDGATMNILASNYIGYLNSSGHINDRSYFAKNPRAKSASRDEMFDIVEKYMSEKLNLAD